MDADAIVLSAGLAALAAVITYIAVARRRERAVRDLEIATVENDDLRKRLLTAEASNNASTGEIARLTGDRERATGLLAKAEERLRQVEDRLAHHERTVLEIGQEKTRLEAEAESIRAQRSEAARKVEALEKKLEEQETASKALADRYATVMAENGALRIEVNSREQRLAEQKVWVEERTRAMEQQISSVAAKMLEEKSRAFTEINRNEMDQLIKPFKDQLGEFRRRVDDIYQADTKERSELREQIRGLTQLNQTVSKQALDLANALTISTKSTGNWGETVLRRILEDSGLREGVSYRLQHRMEGIDGDDRQPDAVIFLPENRQVVVDAKVSNKAWKEYCAASDEADKARWFKEHVASLRSHVRILSDRDYTRSPDLNAVDFALMFVPVEAALLEAMANDESIYTDAYRRKVILVTPTTLLAVVKLVEGMWVVQKRKDSADAVFEAGRKLYEKLVGFVDTFAEVGGAIRKAGETYEKAKGQLSTGKGNAIRLATQMCELGVTPSRNKAFSADFIQLEAPTEDPPVGELPDRECGPSGAGTNATED